MPGGNLSLDDVSATYGNQDTVFVVKDKQVTTIYSDVQNLKENSLYSYRVKATLGTSVSAYSETIGLLTLMNSKVQNQNASSVRIFSKKDKISITGLQGDEMIRVYSLTGICLFQTKSGGVVRDIPMHQNGIFLIRIQDRLSTSTFKIIR